MSDELIERVRKVIATSKRIPEDRVTIDSPFEELGVDSMDAVEILFALENEFDISIPDEEVKSVRNVRQMVEGVERLLAAKSAGTPTAQQYAPRRHHRRWRNCRTGPHRMRVLEEPSGRPPGHRTVGIGGYLRDAFPEWLGSGRLFSHALLRRPPRRFHGPFRAVRGDRGARSRRGSRDRVDPRTARENRHHYRLLRGSPVHRRPRIRGSLQAGPQPRSSADDPQDHGERRGQPHLDGVRHYWPQFHHLDGLLFVGARYRPGGLDDTLRHGGSGVDRRQRSALQLRHPEGLGSHAGGFAGHLPAVLPRPSRHDPGGRRGHAGAGALGSGAGARRANSRRTGGLRHVRGRLPYHAAVRGGRRRGLACPSPSAVTAWSARKARACWCWSLGKRRRRAAREFTPNWWASACPRLPAISRSRPRKAPPGPCAGP